MAFHDLRAFIRALEEEGELIKITAPVSCDLEIAEITDRVSKGPAGQNKALLFTNVQGYEMPVLINAFGSMKRICRALEVSNLDEIGDRIRKLTNPKVPETLMGKLSMLPMLLEVGQFPPKLTNLGAPCQEVVITDPSQAMLDKLPIIKCWPADGGPFVTLPVVITKNPKTGNRNVGVYRMQKFSNTSTGMHWHKHHDGARHFEESRREFISGQKASGASYNSGLRGQNQAGALSGADSLSEHAGLGYASAGSQGKAHNLNSSSAVWQVGDEEIGKPGSLERVLLEHSIGGNGESEHNANMSAQMLTQNAVDGVKNFNPNLQSGLDESSSYQPEEPPNYGTFFQKSNYEQSGNRLPVAIAIGCDPAITYAATAPLPPEIDELVFAGFLRKSPVRMVKCKTVDLEVPATAEIIIEGYVDQKELREEGPFGDHTGVYSLPGYFPVLHVTAITHRKDPIYQTTIVGKPPQEDCYLGKATERIFLPMLQLLVPEIVDMNLPWEGVFHNCAIISIDKRYPGHARKVMSAVWGLGQLMFTKYAIILDKDCDVQNLSEVALRVFGNTDPRRDMMFVDGPLDILDHACPILGYGSKVGIDATRKWLSEGFDRDWPREIEMSDQVKELVNRRWTEYGFSRQSQ
jgi:3-polyprenyl-4-hydroxybenzoate decarboxylase